MPSLSTPAAAQTAADQTTIGFLSAPEATADTRQIFDEDVAELGYVMNASRLWAYQPATATGLFNLVRQANAEAGDADTAAAVLRGVDHGLSASEHAIADWARKVARDPNRTSAAEVQALREAGFSDSQIFTITVFVALRLAFATVNDALGLRPDAGLRHTVPPVVLDAVMRGRPIEEEA